MNEIIDVMLLLTLCVLVLAIFASFIRLIIGPTIWDRILMVNLISVKVVLFVAIYAIYLDSTLMLDIAISYGVIGYLTITLLSKYIMTGGRER
ncbi:monovalent cation/H+ antiporter complex subunit F [Candidatus Xianfuyuplasma coldseepsis]|uniref:pH regulation protein F n=1 Tax=Candidatus Xianfuyuplasma coldseepsis TaxID=2782163 RepID=A0A7L7KPF2_9MOLU|nr:monovalent cation/H+ antiporter complex subunit F [Xianfuyuplasma coldseepsis]QMS84660.1 pH regulation protein F [Xianfuyuplasma coldseepsis]